MTQALELFLIYLELRSSFLDLRFDFSQAVVDGILRELRPRLAGASTIGEDNGRTFKAACQTTVGGCGSTGVLQYERD